jgi:hypothetical protein
VGALRHTASERVIAAARALAATPARPELAVQWYWAVQAARALRVQGGFVRDVTLDGLGTGLGMGQALPLRAALLALE